MLVLAVEYRIAAVDVSIVFGEDVVVQDTLPVAKM